MPNVIDRSRAEALIREQVVSTIFQDAPKQSVVMQLGRKLPNMTSKQTRIPVLSMLPLAYWVNGDTGYKQTSRQAWENVYLTAGELLSLIHIFFAGGMLICGLLWCGLRITHAMHLRRLGLPRCGRCRYWATVQCPLYGRNTPSDFCSLSLIHI